MKFVKAFFINLGIIILAIIGWVLICYVSGTILALAFSVNVPRIHAIVAPILGLLMIVALKTYVDYKDNKN